MALQFIFAAGFTASEFAKFISLSVVLICFISVLQLVQKCYRADIFHPLETEVVYFSSFTCLIL